MFNTKKFKQAFIEAGKQTAKKKQELVKKYKELQEKELVESKVNWIMETIKDLVETWNAKEGEGKMLLINVMSSGRVGHMFTISSQELTGVDQDSSPQKGEAEVEIKDLQEDTPNYTGRSQIVRFGNRFFRTSDAEGYSSCLDEIDKKEWVRLQKYLAKGEENNE